MAKKKKDKFEAPQRNVVNEATQAMTAAETIYPRMLALGDQYNSKFAAQEVNTAAARGAAERGVIEADGGKMAAALRTSTPEISETTAALLARTRETGASAIETELNSQALSDLRLRGRLSAEDMRAASANARAAWQARGLSMGKPAAISEVLNRQQFSDQRQNERRSFAAGVDAQTQQRKASDAAISNNAFNTLANFYDPQMRLFGKGGSQVTGQVGGPQSFNNFLNASSDVGKSNQDAAMAAQALRENARQFDASLAWDQESFAQKRKDSMWATEMQAKSDTTGAWIGAGGAVLGALLLAL